MLRKLRAGIIMWTVVAIALQGPLSVAFSQIPAARAQVGKAAIAVPAALSPRDVFDMQVGIFEELFGQAYDPDEWTYPLDNQVVSSGMYSGVNHLGQAFDLEILVDSPIDIGSPDLDLTATERQWATDNGFEYHAIVGVLSTDLAWIPISGMTVYQSNSIIPFDSRLVVSGTMDPANPIFSSGTQALVSGDGRYGNPGAWPDEEIEIHCVEITLYCRDPDCAQDCYDAYDEALEDAEQAVEDAEAAATAAQDALDSAQDNYDQNIGAATDALAAATAQADAQYATDMNTANQVLALALGVCSGAVAAGHIKCAFVTAVAWWTGGAATLACVLLVQGAFIVCGGIAAAGYAIAEGHASASRANTIRPFQNAVNALSNAVTNAQNALANAQDALQQALNDLQDAMTAAQQELEDCLGDCPLVVCGHITICIVIVTPIGEGGWRDR